MEKLNNCPLCGNNDLEKHLETEDYFLTHERFTIVKCPHCGLQFVNPRPSTDEIAKYYKSENYISHSTQQKGWLDKIYARVRKKNHQKKFKLISKYKQAGAILDIGCATGEFLDFFQKKGWKTCGVEPNEDARKFAAATYNLDVSDEAGLAQLKEKTFDVISMWHVMEHVHDVNERAAQLYRLLKYDGIAVIALPNPNSKDAALYKNFWAGYDLPRHLFHFTAKTIEKLFDKHGFRLVEKIPMVFDAFYISLVSEKYKTGKTNPVKAFFLGARSNFWAKQNHNEFSSMIYVFEKK
ncbi:MAG TPA: methyltransferase domain-containing protein [Bacteroidales bacterium]|jgi:2-polyprenyl-3-methyl-5-hydroxy-6-metoxy-1,4-benzoquinol methylase|nr:methyltransferase domain-containing protein [Bacteroidales bacterium]HPB25456.1 methyltransferase domain-containing protein [Bacteroidales bacterium]HPI30810.1 methyltransferase domain-containing protein [Bacteroidales bacterium]HQN16889.1 methyltransferase domain-containing protein [Bacteroidales bacterium]HQP15776.1 methyltransferase domain-containing protein [Bacteroidales bacterium]